MPRPKKARMVHQPPLFTRFKPIGVRGMELVPIVMNLDEYEAIRLADSEGLDHGDAAAEMEISRSTFTRLLEEARKKFACFLIEGKTLIIQGGEIHFRGNLLKCLNCGHMFNISIEADSASCPACGSPDVLDLAGGFGHGNCCRKHGNRR